MRNAAENKVVYVEIAEPERLVYDHVSGPQFRMTVTFANQGGKMSITAQMLFDSGALRDKMVKEFSAFEGLKQTIGRLGEYVTQMKGALALNANTKVIRGDRELTITRIFDAPRELVFRAWTKPQHLMRLVRAKRVHGALVRGGLPRRRKIPTMPAWLWPRSLGERRISRDRPAGTDRVDRNARTRRQ